MKDFEIALGAFLVCAILIIGGGIYITARQEQRDIAAANRAYAEAQLEDKKQQRIDEWADYLMQNGDTLVSTSAGLSWVCAPWMLIFGLVGWFVYDRRHPKVSTTITKRKTR